MTDPHPFGNTPQGWRPPPPSYPPPSGCPPPLPGHPPPPPVVGMLAAHGFHPVTGEPLSDKSKITAGLLQLPGLVVRRGPRYAALGTAAVVGGAVAYIGVRDPHAPGFGFPTCPFHAVTGWFCPGCGGLRMTHDVLNGDFAAAVVDNAFLLVALPMLAIWLFLRWRSGARLMPPSAVLVIVVAAVGWTVLRNVPGFPLVPTLIGG